MPTPTMRSHADIVRDIQQKHAAQADAFQRNDLTLAATLDAELELLETESKAAKAADETRRSLEQKAADRHKFLSEPVRNVPIPGTAGAGNDGANTHYKRSAGAGFTEVPGVQIKRDNRGHVHTIEYVDRNIDPMEIFQTGGCFWHDVKDIAANSPSASARERIAAWENLTATEAAKVAQTKAQASGLFEGSDPEGGIFVLPELSNEIYRRMVDEQNWMDSADTTVIRGNTMVMNALDDSSRQDGSRYGGVTSYWAAEAGLFANATKPNFRKMDLRLHKLYVVSYITEELFSDSPYALEQEVSKLAALELRFRVNAAMFAGTGSGQPQGIKNSNAAYQVAIETGQTLAGSPIQTENIEKMWNHLNPYCRKNAVWLINLDLEEPLQLMNLPVGTGGSLLYQPVGGLSNPSYATLKGRPVYPVEFTEALGTPGDIVLTDWSHYKMITKGTVASNMSMHVRFLYDELAYKFTFRVDGQPKWDKPLTPYKGTTITSSIVTLAQRS